MRDPSIGSWVLSEFANERVVTQAECFLIFPFEGFVKRLRKKASIPETLQADYQNGLWVTKNGHRGSESLADDQKCLACCQKRPTGCHDRSNNICLKMTRNADFFITLIWNACGNQSTFDSL